jgi:hypothetical protein
MILEGDALDGDVRRLRLLLFLGVDVITAEQRHGARGHQGQGQAAEGKDLLEARAISKHVRLSFVYS